MATDGYFEYYDVLILSSNLGQDQGECVRDLLNKHKPELKVELLEEADFLEQSIHANVDRAMQCALIIYAVITEDWTRRSDTRALFHLDTMLTGCITGTGKATPIPLYITKGSPSKVPWIRQLPSYISPLNTVSRAVDPDNPTRFLNILESMLKSPKMKSRKDAILNVLKEKIEVEEHTNKYEEAKCQLERNRKRIEHEKNMNQLFGEFQALHMEVPINESKEEAQLSEPLQDRTNTVVLSGRRPSGDCADEDVPDSRVVPPVSNAQVSPPDNMPVLIEVAFTQTHQKVPYGENSIEEPFYVGNHPSGDSTSVNIGSFEVNVPTEASLVDPVDVEASIENHPSGASAEGLDET